MRAIAWAMCCSVFGTVPVSAFAKPPEEAHMQLYGTWTAVKAERDGKAADDVVGHQLSFASDRFQIRSKNGEPLYGGTFRLDPSTTPAAMDFEHTDGASKGKAWKGIYAMRGEMLDICDDAPNPKRGRPATCEAKTGSGSICITFTRATPAE